MPILVICPSCSSRLNAPDQAAGKKVKCPKCASVLTVPAAKPAADLVVDEEMPKSKPPIEPPKEQKRSRNDSSETDAHGDQDDRPAKRHRQEVVDEETSPRRGRESSDKRGSAATKDPEIKRRERVVFAALGGISVLTLLSLFVFSRATNSNLDEKIVKEFAQMNKEADPPEKKKDPEQPKIDPKNAPPLLPPVKPPPFMSNAKADVQFRWADYKPLHDKPTDELKAKYDGKLVSISGYPKSYRVRKEDEAFELVMDGQVPNSQVVCTFQRNYNSGSNLQRISELDVMGIGGFDSEGALIVNGCVSRGGNTRGERKLAKFDDSAENFAMKINEDPEEFQKSHIGSYGLLRGQMIMKDVTPQKVGFEMVGGDVKFTGEFLNFRTAYGRMRFDGATRQHFLILCKIAAFDQASKTVKLEEVYFFIN